MKYEFEYFKVKGQEKELTIEADNDKQAVSKLFEKVGSCEFGCIKEDGQLLTDNTFKELKTNIEAGC